MLKSDLSCDKNDFLGHAISQISGEISMFRDCDTPEMPKTFRIHPLIRAIWLFLARRRAAAKRKKLKNLGKSKSTDTEEEDADDDCGDDGELNDATPRIGGSKVGLLVDRLAKNSLHLMVIS